MENANFGEFVCRLSLLNGCPPFENRHAVLRSDGLTRTAYVRLTQALEKKTVIDWREESIVRVLLELAALWYVARDVYSPVPLRVYLAAGTIGLERARTLPESSFQVKASSAITRAALEAAQGAGWLQGICESGTLSAEDLQSRTCWTNAVAKARGLTEPSVFPTGLPSILNADLGPSASQVSRGGGQLATEPPPRRSAAVESMAAMADRCRKCGRKGHSGGDCTKPHPLYREKEASWLIREMAFGRLAKP